MKDYGDDAYLHARIYAMRGRLLSLKDYASMVRGQEPFSEKISADDSIGLKEVVFREQITGVILLAEATMKYTPLFLAFLRMYEANNAKLFLARAFGRQIVEQWYDIGAYSFFDRSLLREGLTKDDLKRILSGSYLDDVLENGSSYERMEMIVDIRTARGLYESSSSFGPEDKRAFQDLMLRRIAAMVLIWKLRLKENFQWGDERIRLYLERLTEAYNGQLWPQVRIVQEELNTRLEQIIKSGGQMPVATDMEHHLEQYYFRWISAMFHKDFHSIYCVAAYLWLLHYQIKNLFRIIEGRKFGLSPDEILEGIICEA